MMNQLAFAFGLLGNIASFMVFLAPLPTFYQMFKKKSTQEFQSTPYIVGLFSAMLWIYYSFLKTEMILLITINSAGCVIYFAYICFFLFFADKDGRVNTMELLLLINVAGFGLILLLTYFLTQGSNRVDIVGWICLVFALSVFVAPLCIVRKVIRSTSVEYMPFLPSFFLTISAVMWFLYGFLLKDRNIAIPNVLGFIFGVVQMVLYTMYKNPKREVEDQKEIPDDIIVMEDQQNKELCDIKGKSITDD